MPRETKTEEIGVITDSAGESLLRMWRVAVPAGARPLRMHSHLSFEVTAVRAGSGIYTVGDSVYLMRAGDFFVFGSNEQHCITDVGMDGLSIVNLHFEPRLLLGSSFDRLTETHLSLCFSHNKDFCPRIENERGDALAALFFSIEKELSARKTEYALSAKSYLNLLLISLVRDYGYATDGHELSKRQTHTVRRVLEYIDRHIGEDFSLSELSQAAGVTANYLSAFFRKVCGVGLWDYVSKKRIENAIRELRASPDSNILEVALRSGFNNTANFNKTFKRVTGVTPSEYRKNGYGLHEV